MASPGDEPLRALEGRDAEGAALWSAWQQARSGRGRIVVVSGEAGIGKSSLLQSLAARASADGARPIWGRAWEFADAPAYFPVAPCLAALGLSSGKHRHESAFVLWEAVLEALSRATSREPVLWLLEDLHAADLQTLDLLAFLAQPLQVLSGLVVVSARPRDPRLGDRGEQRLLRLARDGLDLRLTPLSADGVARLARAHAGELSDDVVRQILELTSGNPLFVVECARALKARGQQDLRGVSPTIRQLVLERLEALPEGTCRLLESAAVLGREFSAAMLGRMHEQLPGRVVDQLLAALRSGIVSERAPGSYLFSHVVVQNAVYESISAEARIGLHHRAWQALAALPAAPEISLECARHALFALTPETEAAALELVLTAGRALEDSGAFDRAHALYGRLREKLALGELRQPLSGQQLLHLADVAERAGKSAESRNLSLSVLSRARAEGDRDLFAHAALELGRGIRPGLVDAELVAALREALAGHDGESALACRLQARLAGALQPSSNPEQPVAMARKVIARARQLDDPALMLEVLDVAGSACVDYAPIDVRLQISEELLERALAAGDFVRSQRARARLAFERAVLGEFDLFDLHVREMLQEADLARRPQARIRPLLMASLAAANRGQARDSADLVAEAEQLLALTDDPSLQLSLRAHQLSRAFLLCDDAWLGQMEPQLPDLVVGVPMAEFTMRALRSMLRTRLDRREDARADLLAAWPVFASDADLGIFTYVLAEVAAYVEERALCEHSRRVLLPFAGQEALGGQVSVSYEGPMDRLLGLLESALGELASAESRLRSALLASEKRGFAAWVAHCRYDLGSVVAKAGRADEASRLWQDAAQLAERCEMPGLVKRVRSKSAGSVSPGRMMSAAPATLVMVREGELYRLELGELSARIRASRGAELLSRLVAVPDQEIHVLALAADDAPASSESNAGDNLDTTALRQYRARLQVLTELISQAEARADLGRLEALQREQSLLEREISRALGLGGKQRLAGSTTERARVNVQRRLKDAVERVSEASPELGAWLARCLRTGTYCAFHPKP